MREVEVEVKKQNQIDENRNSSVVEWKDSGEESEGDKRAHPGDSLLQA